MTDTADRYSDRPLVAIWCLVYNHEQYLRQCLDGIVSQQTDFPFIAIVHDDCSTDGSAAIIREYAARYPEIVRPVLESANLYSRGDGSLAMAMKTACEASGARYVAVCEGDDYWIDPSKLRRQVEFMESHPDYSMCVTNYFQDRGGKLTLMRPEVTADTDVTASDVIVGGGLYCATASLLFRNDIFLAMPDEARRLHVQDYPWQIYMASRGRVRWLADATCAYRIAAAGSWTSANNRNAGNREWLMRLTSNELELLDTMNRLTGGRYAADFALRRRIYLFSMLCHSWPTECLRIFWGAPLSLARQLPASRIIGVHGLFQMRNLLRGVRSRRNG